MGCISGFLVLCRVSVVVHHQSSPSVPGTLESELEAIQKGSYYGAEAQLRSDLNGGLVGSRLIWGGGRAQESARALLGIVSPKYFFPVLLLLELMWTPLAFEGSSS